MKLNKVSYLLLTVSLALSCLKLKNEGDVEETTFPFAMLEEKPDIPKSASTKRMLEYDAKRAPLRPILPKGHGHTEAM